MVVAFTCSTAEVRSRGRHWCLTQWCMGQGMTLFFNCIKCGNRWRDYV